MTGFEIAFLSMVVAGMAAFAVSLGLATTTTKPRS